MRIFVKMRMANGRPVGRRICLLAKSSDTIGNLKEMIAAGSVRGKPHPWIKMTVNEQTLKFYNIDMDTSIMSDIILEDSRTLSFYDIGHGDLLFLCANH